MAENINVTAGVGTPVAADDISGVKYQKIKLIDGKADETTVIEANGGVEANALRVTIASDSTGVVGMPDDVKTITCSLDTSAYADGDVLFDTQEIASAVRNSGDSCTLQSIHILDKDDQGIDFELVFFNAATSLGTENAAISIADADAEDIIGHFAFTNDYVDLINSQIRSEGGIGLELKAGAATTSLYVAGISKGVGTYSASGILISFGFLRN